MSGDRKYMDIAEFRELGLLQEVNRQFFHPIGLALEVVREDDGTERLGGIWDSRDDPEGFIYSDGVDSEKLQRCAAFVAERLPRRHAALGFVVQPVDEPYGVPYDEARAQLPPQAQADLDAAAAEFARVMGKDATHVRLPGVEWAAKIRE